MKMLSGHTLEAQNLLLRIKNICIHYGKIEIIKSVSFQIHSGEAISLIGINGAGKTTILRGITGHKKLSSGSIWFDGTMIESKKPHEIAKMGIAHIMQGRKVFPDLTVEENLKIGAYLAKNINDTRVNEEEIFAFFPRLRERLKQKAKTLSGGEQQMLVTARAIISKPKLLILDEPSGGLSPIMVQETGKVIKLISQKGISILLVEQNAYLAFNTTSRAYVLETGKIVMEGDSKELTKDNRIRDSYLGN